MNAKRPAIPALDGLRAMACLAVLYRHIGELGIDAPFLYGTSGVNLFFTLSGFLMTYHYLPGSLSWRYWIAYLIRRFFRVYMVFAIVMLMFWACSEFWKPLPIFKDFNGDTLINELMLHGFISTYWTIAIEIKFYLFFPIIGILFLLLKLSPKKNFILLTLALVCSLVLNPFNDVEDRSILWKHIPYFIGGMWGALTIQTFDLRQLMPTYVWNGMLLICLLIAIPYAFFLQMDFFNPQHIHYDHLYYLACPLFAVITVMASFSSGWMLWLLANPAMRFIGLISYSLYLCHRLVWGIGLNLFPDPSLSMACGIFAFTFVFATAFHYVIEKPFNSYGKKLAGKIMRVNA